MLKAFRDANIAQIRQRISEGDCPITPALSVEMLENIVVELADEVAILSTRPAETLASLSSEGEAVVQAILDKLHRELPYPTEACALVRAAAKEHAALASTTSQSDVIEKCGEALKLSRPIVEADLDTAKGYSDADWIGMSQEALDAIDAALASKEGQHHG